MFKIELFELGYCKDSKLTRVVCVSKYKGKFVFSFNKKRNGWEIPGGHIENGETWEEAAKREMYEETGAIKVKLIPIAIYKISTFALLCYCEIEELTDLPKEYEMSSILLSDDLPDNLTYPDTFKLLFDTVCNKMN